MGMSTAVSVASFSVILAESFAAVAMSTIVPAAFLSIIRGAKGVVEANQVDGTVYEKIPGVKDIVSAAKAGAKNIDAIDLLVPKTAKIHAEFEFQGGEAYELGVEGSVAIEVVNVSASYSALYQSTTRNKITLDVDFVAVNYTI